MLNKLFKKLQCSYLMPGKISFLEPLKHHKAANDRDKDDKRI
jgi:hypothetical protein